MLQSGESVHLLHYLRIILARKSLILFCVLVSFFLVYVLNQWITPVYQAKTRLLVEEKLQDVNLGKNLLLPYQKEFFETQKEILLSESVFEAVVLELALHQKKQNSVLEPLKSRLKDLLGLGFELSPAQQERELLDRAIDSLRHQVYVEGIRGTNIIEILVEDINPESAMKIANSLSFNFISRSLQLRNRDSLKASEFLSSQVQEVQKKLNQAEKKLEEFQFTKEAISLDKRIEFLVENQIVVAEKEYEQVKVDLEEEREKVEILHLQVNAERTKKSSGDKGTSRVLIEQQIKFELRLNELKRKFTEEHPEVKALRKSLDLLKDRILAEEKAAKSGDVQASNEFLQVLEKEFSESQRKYRVLAVREEQLKKQLVSQQEKLRELLRKKADYLVLKRELSASEQIYELLLKKHKEVGVESTLNLGHVKQVQEATLPVVPIRPKKLLNLGISLICGFFLGMGLAFLFEYLDQSLKTKEEILSCLGDQPLLGVLYEQEVLRKETHLLPTITMTNPNCALSENFKILRANIQIYLDSGIKKIVVTSSLPAEGKTTVSCNLAITFARNGKKVLLMDCDLRKAKIADSFQIAEIPSQKQIFSTEQENLFLWKISGVKDFTNFLDSVQFHESLDIYSQEYDLVILDCAPLNLVSDTACLLSHGISVLFVVGAGVNTKEQLSHSLGILKNLRTQILGFVLSRLEMQGTKKGYHDYYHQYFSISKQDHS